MRAIAVGAQPIRDPTHSAFRDLTWSTGKPRRTSGGEPPGETDAQSLS
jgi:hypothetical protein